MENNQVIRKIRKIKRPKPSVNPAMQQPTAPTKAGLAGQPQAAPVPPVQQQSQPQNKLPPKINFGSPAPNQVRNLPQASTFKQDTLYTQNNGVENIRFVSESAPNDIKSGNIAELLKNKTILLLMGLSAIFGLFLGVGTSSGSTSSKNGLDWVVANPDVPAGRSRCGLVDQHQGCVLYVMNPEKRNVTGKDFYSVAAKWTKRERYQIETGNMHYGSKQIKPGHIAQINIPPL